MRIIISKKAGFCFGVKRACDLLETEYKNNKNILTLGPIIHNPRYIKSLQERGINITNNLNNVENKTLIIQSHGTEKNIYSQIQQKNINYIDATCPIVIKSQQIVNDLNFRNIFTIIIGDPDHSEIKSLKSFSKPSNICISTDKDLIKTIKKESAGVLAQTTIRHDLFNDCISILKENIKNLEVYKTICNATKERQESALELTKEASIIIVIGGRNSSNTSKLASICKEINPRTYHIEDPKEIDPTWFKANDVIGVTAGASTPEAQIGELITHLKTNFRDDFQD